MASSYVNDLRLNEMATGDASGTWGDTTNTNLELIAEAFSYGTEAITTNADTHTTTIADGASDPGRALYLKYTGTLDSACTITIGPNTVSKVWIVENATSGSQNIILSQGSGANITIPAGDTKVVYSDGAGAGAAFFDAFASLSVVDLKVQDDLTVTGVLTGASLDISGDIDIDGTANLDIVDIDGAVDMASTLQVDGAITSSAGATITLADNGIALNLISTDADANEGPGMVFYRNSSSPADNDALGQIYLQGENDADQKVTYSIIEAFIDDASDGTEDGILRFSSMVAGTSRNRMDITPAATVFNEDSVDVDFRVESDNNANALFVQGSDGNVGIGITPTAKLDLLIDTDKRLTFSGGIGEIGNVAGFQSINSAGSALEPFGIRAEDIRFATGSSERLRINSDGDLLVGTTESVSTSSSQVGGEMRSNGIAVSAVNSNPCTIANRIGTDGDITLLRKNGVTIGSIGTLNADPWMARANGCGVRFITAAWLPATATGADSDDTVDLGTASVRFDNIYATNATIQTSDRNEKQDIAELTDAETRVAVAAKGLLRKFRWKSAVEEKGDEARYNS
jgi:filamentous hemagglutinin family protein